MLPRYALAYYCRGYVYDDMREYLKAIEDYSKAISLKPDYAKAYYNRAAAYKSLGNDLAANSDYQMPKS